MLTSIASLSEKSVEVDYFESPLSLVFFLVESNRESFVRFLEDTRNSDLT